MVIIINMCNAMNENLQYPRFAFLYVSKQEIHELWSAFHEPKFSS